MVNEKLRFLSKDALSNPVQIDARFGPIFEFARRVSDIAANVFFLGREVPADDCELLARLLVGRLLQDYESAVLLADRGFRAQSRAAARSTFETAVYLVGMSRKTPLELKKGEEGITLDQLILSGHQRYRRNMANELALIKDTPEELKKSLTELIEQLSDEPNLRITFEAITKQLDLWDMYTVLYRSLSQDSHISAISLEHHLSVNDAGRINGFNYGPDFLQYDDTIKAAIASLLLGMCAYVENLGQKKELDFVTSLVAEYRQISEADVGP